MQIIPAIDVLGGSVVRLRQGDYEKVTRYGDDPVEVAVGLIGSGADLIHVVDLAAARSGVSSPGIWPSLGSAAIPFQAAGGIRTREDAAEALGSGAQRIVAGTAAVWDVAALREVLDLAGDRLVAAVDVRDGRAVGAGWTDEGRALESVLDDLLTAGVSRLMVTAVATDGMLTGPDLSLFEWILGRVEVAVIASGGVGTLADITSVRDLGAEAIVVGRALYDARFTLVEAIEAAS